MSSYESINANIKTLRTDSIPGGTNDDLIESSETGKGGKILVAGQGGQRWMNPDEKPTPFELNEPNWRTDTSVTGCMSCSTPFSLFVRRHHCRRCGDIFCGDCAALEIPVLRLAFLEEVKVCKTCKAKVEKENEFFNSYIKVLQRGGIFKMLKNGVTLDVLVQLANADKDLLVSEIKMVNGVPKKANGADAYYQSIPVETLVEVKNVRKPADASGARLEYIFLKTSSVGDFEFSTEDKQQKTVWATSLRKAIEIITDNDLLSTPISATPPDK